MDFFVATCLRVAHSSRFILASIPVEYSSTKMTDGLPAHLSAKRLLDHSTHTNECDGKSQFPLIASGEFSSQSVSVKIHAHHVQKRVYIALQLSRRVNTLQPAINIEMLVNSKVVVDSGELRANTITIACGCPILPDRCIVDDNVPTIRVQMTAWDMVRSRAGL